MSGCSCQPAHPEPVKGCTCTAQNLTHTQRRDRAIATETMNRRTYGLLSVRRVVHWRAICADHHPGLWGAFDRLGVSVNSAPPIRCRLRSSCPQVTIQPHGIGCHRPGCWHRAPYETAARRPIAFHFRGWRGTGRAAPVCWPSAHIQVRPYNRQTSPPQWKRYQSHCGGCANFRFPVTFALPKFVEE